MPVIEGRVKAVPFFNEKNLFTIARIETGDGVVSVLGNLGRLEVGGTIRAEGEWEVHPRYGEQFRAVSARDVFPASEGGLARYLERGFIKGIGPGLARRIAEHFGDKTLEILDGFPERLLDVPGIGKKKLAEIRGDWEPRRIERRVLLFCADHGIAPALAGKILEKYGGDSIRVISENPYRLAEEVPGIGFSTADAVARKMGIAKDAEGRLFAGLFHVLEESSGQGNFFMYEDGLLLRAAQLLGAPRPALAGVLERLASQGRLIAEKRPGHAGRLVYLPAFLAVEKGLAHRLKAFLSVPAPGGVLDAGAVLSEVHERMGIRLSEEQIEVLRRVFGHRLSVITGGPGTGKTTLVRAIQRLCEAGGKRLLLAAPTGRAAKRLSEVTSRQAATIHRMLGYDFEEDTFRKNALDPLRR